MRLNPLAILTVLATASTVFADRMSVNSACPCNWCGSCNSREAWFYTDFGTYKVNANEGCRKTGIPGMTEFCVDWGKNRGHFKFNHQDWKRCMIVRSRSAYGCNADHCERTEWEEWGCSWKTMPSNETLESTSQAAAPIATAAPIEG